MERDLFNKEEADSLEEWLSPGKGFLLYHGDADGACSAALLLRFFPGFEHCPRKGPAMDQDFIRTVLDKRPETLVFLDMAADQEQDTLKTFLREIPGLRIIIIDHHISTKDMNSERILHINPRFRESGVYIPAACVVYHLLKLMGMDVRPLSWISAMGVIGDYGWPGCPQVLMECGEEYPFLLEGRPQDSRLGEGAKTIAAATTVKGLKGVAECLKALLKAEGFEDFESYGKLKEWRREFETELEQVMDDYRAKRKVFAKEGLVTYELDSRLNITSILSTKLGEAMPDRVIAIRKPEKGMWKVSMRNQSGRVNLGELARQCSEGMGSGGGHEKAAAALVSDWKAFLERLRKAISSS